MKHHKLAVLAALALLASTAPVHAGPLDPPPSDSLRVWLVKRQGSAPRPLTSVVRYRQASRNGWGALLIVGFEMRGKRRDLLNGYHSFGVMGEAPSAYPYAYHDGTTTPACPAEVLCATPDPLANPYEYKLSGDTTNGKPTPIT